MIRWKQFLVPVKSWSEKQVREFIEQHGSEEFTLLDVRQPAEYERGHIPGSKLIPIPELVNRLDELDRKKRHIVYCAVGGRSRMAAQMLAGKGFDDVINFTGGFKEWNGHSARGDEIQGIEFFTGSESPADTLVAAYSLEKGLGEFYVSMAEKSSVSGVKTIFNLLATIEVRHQDIIFDRYLEISENQILRDEFDKSVVPEAMEGGMSAEEYGRLFSTDWESVRDVVSLAMSIEAQALDMYSRISAIVSDEKSRTILMQIAEEERMHLVQLGELMERVV